MEHTRVATVGKERILAKTLLKMLELAVSKIKSQDGQVWTVKQDQRIAFHHSVDVASSPPRDWRLL